MKDYKFCGGDLQL